MKFTKKNWLLLLLLLHFLLMQGCSVATDKKQADGELVANNQKVEYGTSGTSGQKKETKIKVQPTQLPPNETLQSPLTTVKPDYYYRPREEFGFFKTWSGETPLKTGDEYAIRFKSDKDCYVYVYKVGEQNNITDLLPKENFPSGQKTKFEKGQRHILPSDMKVFKLDERKVSGKDQIYFLAFEKPNADLETLYQRLSKAQTDNASEVKSLQEQMLKKLGVVSPFTFEHQLPSTNKEK